MKLYAGKVIRTCSRREIQSAFAFEHCSFSQNAPASVTLSSGSKALNIGKELLCALPARFRPQRFH